MQKLLWLGSVMSHRRKELLIGVGGTHQRIDDMAAILPMVPC